MRSPRLMPGRQVIPLDALMGLPVLIQRDRSGSGLSFDTWLQRNGATPSRMIRSSSLIALVGLTVAAVGISDQPRHCLKGLVGRGDLRLIESDPALPVMTSVMMVGGDKAAALVHTLSDLTRPTCDVGSPVRRSCGRRGRVSRYNLGRARTARATMITAMPMRTSGDTVRVFLSVSSVS